MPNPHCRVSQIFVKGGSLRRMSSMDADYLMAALDDLFPSGFKFEHCAEADGVVITRVPGNGDSLRMLAMRDI